MSWRVSLLLLAAGLLTTAAAADFGAPVALTDAEQNYRFARLGGGNAVFDGGGNLHVTYWAGGFATSSVTPSRVYYQRWNASSGWADAIQMDEASLQNGSFVGGRHPGITVAPDGTAWVAWQDHRHSGEAGNFINNQEIYIRPVALAGAVGTEVRLTNTTTAHSGDNGYTPRLAVHDDGRIAVLWYDFNADGSRSDLYIVRSDTGGVFDISGGLASQRLTDESERPAGFTQSYVIPDLAIGTTGTEVGVWTEGTSTGGPVLASVLPTPTAIIALASVQTVGSDTGSFFTPGRVVAAADGGFWTVFTDTSVSPRVVRVARMEESGTTFGASEVVVSAIGAHAEAGDVALDANGVLHLAWVERPTAATVERTVRYGTWDPDAPGAVVGEAVSTVAAEYEKVSIALNGDGDAFVLFEERINSSTGEIWFAGPALATSVGDWMVH